MQHNNCEICSLFPIENPLLETEHWVVSLSPDQGYLGRCYVSLKEHKDDMANLTKSEWLEFAELVKNLEQAVRTSFDARLFNWGCLMNNAFQKSPALPHVHWHFRPRYDTSVIFDTVEFTDPMFGYHYDRAQSLKVSDKTLSLITETIKENLT